MFPTLTTQRSATPEVISFRTTRRAIGLLGILLPVALFFSSLSPEGFTLQPSISHFYYTNMREIFVGVLCAVSLFLFSYKGHSRMDSWASNAAGFFSLGVALFPTNIIENYPRQAPVVQFIDVSFHNAIHLSCAALFFITLALMSLFLFTKSGGTMTPEKETRNTIYKICGGIMILSIFIIGISGPVFEVSDTSQITFWFETVALFSFGLSWLIKGEALMGDKPDFENLNAEHKTNSGE